MTDFATAEQRIFALTSALENVTQQRSNLLAELEDVRKLAGERARRLHAIEDLHEMIEALDGSPVCAECSVWTEPERRIDHPCATVRLANGEEL